MHTGFGPYLLLLSVILLPFSSYSSEVDSSNTQTIPRKDKVQRWVFIPAIGREEETSWKFGLVGMHFFPKKNPANAVPKVQFNAVGSFHKQLELRIIPDIWLNNNRDHFSGNIEGRVWPSSVFEPGQNSPDTSQQYESKSLEIKGEYSRKIINNFFVGAGYRFQVYGVKTDEEGILAESYALGLDGGYLSGIGLLISYDNRDHKIWPGKGGYFSIKPQLNHSLLGSEFDFRELELDARKFFSPFGESVIGFAGQLKIKRGDIPFFKLSRPDGNKILRGLNTSRYRERDFIGGQTEYRSPFMGFKKAKWLGPIAFTVFVEAGQVAYRITDMDAEDFIYGLGGGFRYCVAPKELVNIRADLAYVDDAVSLVLEFEEAF